MTPASLCLSLLNDHVDYYLLFPDDLMLRNLFWTMTASIKVVILQLCNHLVPNMPTIASRECTGEQLKSQRSYCMCITIP